MKRNTQLSQERRSRRIGNGIVGKVISGSGLSRQLVHRIGFKQRHSGFDARLAVNAINKPTVKILDARQKLNNKGNDTYDARQRISAKPQTHSRGNAQGIKGKGLLNQNFYSSHLPHDGGSSGEGQQIQKTFQRQSLKFGQEMLNISKAPSQMSRNSLKKRNVSQNLVGIRRNATGTYQASSGLSVSSRLQGRLGTGGLTSGRREFTDMRQRLQQARVQRQMTQDRQNKQQAYSRGQKLQQSQQQMLRTDGDKLQTNEQSAQQPDRLEIKDRILKQARLQQTTPSAIQQSACRSERKQLSSTHWNELELRQYGQVVNRTSSQQLSDDYHVPGSSNGSSRRSGVVTLHGGRIQKVINVQSSSAAHNSSSMVNKRQTVKRSSSDLDQLISLNQQTSNDHYSSVQPPPTKVVRHEVPAGPRISQEVEMKEYTSPIQGTRVLISNLMPSVILDDIMELFGAMGAMKRVRLLKAGQAEIVYVEEDSAHKAVRKYHHRELDGKPMQVVIEERSGDNSGYIVRRSSPTISSTASESVSRSRNTSLGTVELDLDILHRALFKTSSTPSPDQQQHASRTPVSFTVHV